MHDYLGKDLDYSEKVSVKVSMIKYTGKILRLSPKNIVGSAASPAAENLFKVGNEKDAKYLPEEQSQRFHHTTAQQLFMCSRSRRYIQTAVAVITTRVNDPYEYD